MQIESPKEKKLTRIDKLADEIRGRYLEANQLKRSCETAGRAAVVAAYECGQLLNQAKKCVGEGWERWVINNAGIELRTAQNWMRLAKAKHISFYDNDRNLTSAYRRIEIIKKPLIPEKAIGTQDVDICENFINQIIRECNKIEALVTGVDLSGISPARRNEAKEAIAKVKDLEARL